MALRVVRCLVLGWMHLRMLLRMTTCGGAVLLAGVYSELLV